MYQFKTNTNNMKINEKEMISLLKSGESIKSISSYFKVNQDQISSYRRTMNIPCSKVLLQLKNYNNFEAYFTELYNSTNDIKFIVSELSKHPLFCRKKMSDKRVSELRTLYGLKCKMPENVYLTQYDRIRGYMIRNTKFMSGRRNIYFDLKYTDFEIPEYCPILGLKLTYMSESNGNDPSHASLDRIDNNLGYVKGNVFVISRLANAMKNSASFDQLDLFCVNMKKLIDYKRNQGALGSITDVFGDFSPKLSLDY